MSAQPDSIQNILLLYNFSNDESKVYLNLIKKDRSSALEISKDLKMGRTKVYRVLEKLVEKGFVKEEVKDYGTKFVAESYEKLGIIVEEKEREAKELRKFIPELYSELARLKLQSKEDYKVLYYRGVEGLKQVTWNSLLAKDVLRIYEINDMNAFLDKKFAEKVRLEFAKRKVKVHQLTNFKEINDYTDVHEHIKFWTPKYIDPSELEIKFEIIIYNDVYCMYSYDEEKKDIFCIEVHNSRLAKMQKQLFDFIWSKALEMKVVSKKGRAVLK